MTEAEVTKAFVARLAYERWARLLRLPLPKGRTKAAKAMASAQRVRIMSEAAQAIEQGRAAVALWRQNTGVAVGAAGYPVQYGLPGASDFDGIGLGGRRVCVELKSPKGRLSPEQEGFRELVLAAGGIYLVVRDGVEGVKDLRKELGC